MDWTEKSFFACNPLWSERGNRTRGGRQNGLCTKKEAVPQKKLTNGKKSVRIKEKKRYALKIEARQMSCCVIRRKNDSAIE